MLYKLRKLRVGFAGRCPNCELGKLQDEHGKLRSICLYCHSRFEHAPGEMFGAVYLNMAFVEILAIVGFIGLHLVFSFSLLQQFVVGIPSVLILMWAFSRRAQGLWIAVLFLMDRVYPDPDYERQYINPLSIPKAPQEYE